MWRGIGIGLLGRLAAYAAFLLGFWLLYQAFGSDGAWRSVGLGLAGGVTVLAATYLMVGFRRRVRS